MSTESTLIPYCISGVAGPKSLGRLIVITSAFSDVGENF